MDWKLTGSGQDVDWKWTESGLEVDQKCNGRWPVRQKWTGRRQEIAGIYLLMFF